MPSAKDSAQTSGPARVVVTVSLELITKTTLMACVMIAVHKSRAASRSATKSSPSVLYVAPKSTKMNYTSLKSLRGKSNK